MDTDLVVFLLAMARFSPLLMVPALGPLAWVPGYVRVIMLTALSVIALGSADMHAIQAHVTESPWLFGLAMAGESLVGLTFALATVLPMAALGFAARMVDMQSGVAAASVLNPSTRTTESLFGTVIQWSGMVVFFALGLHVVLLRGLVSSMQLVPIGSGSVVVSPGTFLGLLSTQFLLGLMVLLPVILGLFAIDLGTAYASRSMPQANIYFVALPLKLLAGFTLLAATLSFAPPLIERLFRNAFAALPMMGGH
ncbi:flagellar biosynthetic protein FliR [Dyella sp.]|uniref:flagellar biosynthetic protein FliR n=1 Tax=Dyella sp. TaxID=1869338 RepID=UPI00283D34E1|nr:flagellar biosynthetic protein FliR [Dyella sp.]MDR3443752.1 flagellar biosynthetic protein FliR [Dyella sp.]